MTNNISIIVAVAENFAIGKNNDLLCYLPGDLKRFKAITQGHPVIMGRNTWDSLPKKPLPLRKNIVLTRNKNYVAQGALVFHSPEKVLEHCKNETEIFIIGGAEIYNLFMPMARKLYITHIYKEFEGDTFLNKIHFSDYRIVEKSDIFKNDEGIEFQYITYSAKHD